jgi:hypothetical protein
LTQAALRWRLIPLALHRPCWINLSPTPTRKLIHSIKKQFIRRNRHTGLDPVSITPTDAKERKQFNRVIGSFQAVKHMCSEMAAELEPCRSLVWYSAHAANAIPEEARLMACHAKAHLSEVGQFIACT